MSESERGQGDWGSNPSAIRRSGSARGTPSIHSIVITSRVVRLQSTTGARTSGSSFEFSTNSDAAAASSRKSISMRTERASVSTTWASRRRRNSGARLSANRAANAMSERSRPKRRSVPARSTLTATGRKPSLVCTSARWTWAIEAAATGSPKLSNSDSIFMPKEASTMATAISRLIGATRSCSRSSSMATLPPTMSGRVERNCPSFT